MQLSVLADWEKIIEYVSLFFGKQITDKTLLIFDEVQECPNIISSLKYFCQDFRQIPVIATGSMVRIKIQRETHKRGAAQNDKFLFPVGKINQMTVYPMTFDEFLMNGNRVLYEKIKDAYEKKKPLVELLSQDPRPHYHNDPDRIYGFSYAGFEVRFRVSEGVLIITEIEAI